MAVHAIALHNGKPHANRMELAANEAEGLSKRLFFWKQGISNPTGGLKLAPKSGTSTHQIGPA